MSYMLPLYQSGTGSSGLTSGARFGLWVSIYSCVCPTLCFDTPVQCMMYYRTFLVDRNRGEDVCFSPSTVCRSHPCAFGSGVLSFSVLSAAVRNVGDGGYPQTDAKMRIGLRSLESSLYLLFGQVPRGYHDQPSSFTLGQRHPM